MNRFFATLLLAALPTAAMAGATPWQQVAPDVRLRLISSDMLKPDGTTLAALEVDMPQGTRTYWRVPGESGIPTQIDTSASSGVASGQVLWPLPQIDTSNDIVDFVYTGPTVLPLSVKVDGSSARLAAKVSMGICTDVCMPVNASFELPLQFGKADHSEGLRIAQAVSAVPIAWDGAADPIGAVDYDAATSTLSVQVADPGVDVGSIVADAGIDGVFFGAPQKRPDDQIVDLPLLGNESNVDLRGHAVELSFMTESGPYSVTRPVGEAGSTATNR